LPQWGRIGNRYVSLPILFPVMRHFNWAPIRNGDPVHGLEPLCGGQSGGLFMERISRAALPFVLALFAALMVVTYTPSLSLWLPRIFGLW